MSVIRVVKNRDYFAASNIPFNDEELSWEARGVMGYLLSKPDEWQVMFNDLIKRGPAGEHKMRRILKELEQQGYLERERINKSDGTFEWVSTVYEDPTISRLSIYGLSTYGSTTYGKPRDILSTESLNTELEKMTELIDEEGKNLFSLYENNIGMITPMVAEKLREAEREYPVTWFEPAIQVAVEANARNWRYVSAVLENWAVKGYGWKPGDDGHKDETTAERVERLAKELEDDTRGK